MCFHDSWCIWGYSSQWHQFSTLSWEATCRDLLEVGNLSQSVLCHHCNEDWFWNSLQNTVLLQAVLSKQRKNKYCFGMWVLQVVFFYIIANNWRISLSFLNRKAPLVYKIHLPLLEVSGVCSSLRRMCQTLNAGLMDWSHVLVHLVLTRHWTTLYLLDEINQSLSFDPNFNTSQSLTTIVSKTPGMQLQPRTCYYLNYHNYCIASCTYFI